jgi:hypothetical protein
MLLPDNDMIIVLVVNQGCWGVFLSFLFFTRTGDGSPSFRSVLNDQKNQVKN